MLTAVVVYENIAGVQIAVLKFFFVCFQSAKAHELVWLVNDGPF